MISRRIAAAICIASAAAMLLAQNVRPPGAVVGTGGLLPIAQVEGLLDELAARAKKTLSYQPGRVLKVAENGDLEGIVGAPGDCIKADGTTGACGSAGGGSAAGIWSEVPSGTINGTNPTFTILQTPISNTLRLYKNGIRQRAGVDYTLSGYTITFLAGAIPQSSDILQADYQLDAGAGFIGEPSSVDGEIAVWEGTTGTNLKRATLTGVLKAAAGVLSSVTGNASDCVKVDGSSGTCGSGGSSYTAADSVCVEDFVGSTATYNSSNDAWPCGWRAQRTGSGSVTKLAAEAGSIGMIRYNTSAADDATWSMSHPGGGLATTNIVGANWDITARVRVNQDTAFEWIFGAYNTGGALTSLTDGCWLFKAGGSTSFILRCRTGGADTSSSAFGTLTASTWIVARVWRDGNTVYAKVGSFIDTVLVATTGQADASLSWNNSTAIGFAMYTDFTSATANNFDVDYIRTAITGVSR